MSMSKVVKVIEECGKMYNFDVEDALRALKIEKVSSKVEGSKKLKLSFPMPFGGVKNENCCNGIVKNHGLYTQCEKKPMLVKEGEVKSCFCKGCQEEPYGNIDDRVSKGLYEFKDPKGKSPKRYTEVLKKLKIAKETVEEETKRLNLTINSVHFEEVVEENVKRGRPKAEKKVKEPTGKKGRPKKEKKTVEVSEDLEEDLFASLIAKAQNQPLDQPLEKVEPNSQENVIVEEVNEVLAEPLPKVEKKAKKVDPAKEAEKQKKAEEKAAKEAAKEAEKQKKAEEKAAKEAEKQKKAEEKAAKEATKESKKKSKDLATPLPNVEEEADVVKKIEFGGKSYYKSNKNGVIYNMEQEVVGKWNAETNDIDFEEEEEEEEYDE
jgi:chemotaxis protein histidine kinase CheA